jgi:hypothetical protein
MPVTLLVEDGTNVAGANSFVTLDEIKAYATARNRVIPDDDELLAQYAIRAMDYIVSFRNDFNGERTYDDQPLPFPRSNLYIDRVLFDQTKIPVEIKNVQCQLVIEIAAGVELFPTTQGQNVKRKRVGPLETEWFDPGGFVMVRSVEMLLGPLLARDKFTLRTQRV